MNALQTWMNAASPDERELLAKHAKTTVHMLHQIAGGYRTDGKPYTNAELAGRLEDASKLMPAFLPRLLRVDLCRACSQCSYALAGVGRTNERKKVR